MYHEAPSAAGVTATGGLAEVLVSDKGSWTILITTPDGKSCLVVWGDGWKTFHPVETGPKA